uniref:Uncharacterized protein n=1 Tax=Panagrolaimus sp. ES5 TaxID=591445 RepID=A0AC34FCF4_9BILA
MLGLGCQAQKKDKVEKLNVAEFKAKAIVSDGTVSLADGKNVSTKSYGYEYVKDGVSIYTSGDDVSGFVQTETAPLPQMFVEVKWYYPDGTLKSKGASFKKDSFEKGTWTYYDASGNLEKTEDKDAPYQAFPWEKVLEVLKQKNISYEQIEHVGRVSDAKGTFWNIAYMKDKAKHMGESFSIDVKTGQVINVKPMDLTIWLD